MRLHSRLHSQLNEASVQWRAHLRIACNAMAWKACALIVLSGLSAMGAQAADPAVEDQIKAAFLYKFGGYVDWPAQVFERPDSPLAIGVMGSDAFVTVLSQIAAGRDVNGHAIEIRKLQKGAPIAGLHMVFVAQPDEAAVQEAVAAAKGQSILIVTAHERGLIDGGMINFVVEGNKVRFDIAIPTAEQSNLKISARLLSVARKVVTKPS